MKNLDIETEHIETEHIETERVLPSPFGRMVRDDRATSSAATPPSSPPPRNEGEESGGTQPFTSSSSSRGFLDPQDRVWTRRDTRPLPGWVQQFRPAQLVAVERVVELYNQGIKTVFLDAPTGAGKTLIAELVRRRVADRTVYTCHGLGLQDQFLHDYDYAAVLKGRSNYPTQTMPYPDVTCADCTKGGQDEGCLWCPQPVDCAYTTARRVALRDRLVVTNMSYMLAEMQGKTSGLAGRDLVVVDEADVLEQALMGVVEFRVTSGMARRLGVQIPRKSAHKPTVVKWIRDTLLPAVSHRLTQIRGDRLEQLRERKRLNLMAGRARRVANDLEEGLWVRDYGYSNKDLVLKAVKVDGYGQDRIWRHAERWLLMSATIISADEMVDSLGIEGGRGEQGGWEIVHVPMEFPTEHRPIYPIPVAGMTRKEQAEGILVMGEAIGKLCDMWPDDRILVHTHSYKLAEQLAMYSKTGNRPVYMYEGARDRERVVGEFKGSDAGILFAPSVDRGFDFVGDEARVVVVAKIPFPYLGDRVIGERIGLEGGQAWYQVQTVRSLVQMTGRGVRSGTDWAATYILDQSYYKQVKRFEGLLPRWWREAVDETITPRELMGW